MAGRLDGRCGQCENCQRIERMQANMLRAFNPYHSDNHGNMPHLVPGREQQKDAMVQMWNEALRDWPCTVVWADYVSVWDDEDEIRTPCKWDMQKRVAFDIGSSDEPDGANALTREFVELADGTQIDVDHELETKDGIPAIKEQESNPHE